MKRLSELISQYASGRVAILATVIFIAFMVIVLPRQSAQSEAITGGGGSPDTSFWYTADRLYQFAETYGEAGRNAYVRTRWTFDLIYPMVYGFFLVSTTSQLFKFAFTPDSSWRRMNLLPLFGVILDYLENSATSLVMARYPAPSPLVVEIAPYLTLLKWLFVGASFIALFVGSGLALFQFYIKSRRQSTM